MKLPRANANMTHPQYRKFITDWNVYKCMTSFPVQQIPSYLYSACDETVRNSLVNSHRNLFEMDETAMLKAIEQVVTRSANPAVHRMNFGNLMQHENEPIKGLSCRITFHGSRL